MALFLNLYFTFLYFYPILISMEIYKYNNGDSYASNFYRWFWMNSDERTRNNEKPYTREQGKEVFYNIYKNKLAHTIRINADGILEDVLVLEE